MSRPEQIEEDVFKKQILEDTKYIYAVKSAAFPGLVKIGRTQNVNERISQLNTACAPLPFKIVTVSPTLDFKRDEKKAHEHFSDQRKMGEFFEVTESQVKDFFQTIRALYEYESQQTSSYLTKKNESDARNAKIKPLLYMLVDGLARESRATNESRKRSFSDANAKEKDSTASFKRRRGELELKIMEEDLMMKRQTRIADLHQKLKDVCNPGKNERVEERVRLFIKDMFTNMLFGANDSTGHVSSFSKFLNKRVLVTDVVGGMGFEFSDMDIERVEEDLEERYKERHGKTPPKYEFFHDDQTTMTSFYTERDRDLIEKSVQEYFTPWVRA